MTYIRKKHLIDFPEIVIFISEELNRKEDVFYPSNNNNNNNKIEK